MNSPSQTMETINISTPMIINIPSFIPRKRLRPKHRRLLVASVMKPSNLTVTKTTDAITFNSNVTTTTKTVYKDNWFDRIAINYLAKALQDTSGMRNEESGYESLVVASKAVFRSFNPIQQRELMVKVLVNAIPRPYISMLRTLFIPSKFAREFCAAFTTLFLVWLIGPCKNNFGLKVKKIFVERTSILSSASGPKMIEPALFVAFDNWVKESEFDGVKEKNVVYVKKCRFLETTNCAGMCTNLCKVPTQEFMKSIFGMPINMVPNFEDMSCEYIFGENPPSLQDDPALRQPCYKLCNVKHKHDASCID